jgi:predicted kinase
MELVILVGQQGAGRSTCCRAFLADTHVRVSKDHFRNNRHPARRQRQFLEEVLAAGRSAVVDNANGIGQEREELIALCRSFGARLVSYFESRLEECLRRNRFWAVKEHVPDMAVYATRKRLEVPSLAERFDQLLFVRLLGDSRFEVRDLGIDSSG